MHRDIIDKYRYIENILDCMRSTAYIRSAEILLSPAVYIKDERCTPVIIMIYDKRYILYDHAICLIETVNGITHSTSRGIGPVHDDLQKVIHWIDMIYDHINMILHCQTLIDPEDIESIG